MGKEDTRPFWSYYTNTRREKVIAKNWACGYGGWQVLCRSAVSTPRPRGKLPVPAPFQMSASPQRASVPCPSCKQVVVMSHFEGRKTFLYCGRGFLSLFISLNWLWVVVEQFVNCIHLHPVDCSLKAPLFADFVGKDTGSEVVSSSPRDLLQNSGRTLVFLHYRRILLLRPPGSPLILLRLFTGWGHYRRIIWLHLAHQFKIFHLIQKHPDTPGAMNTSTLWSIAWHIKLGYSHFLNFCSWMKFHLGHNS